MKGMNDYSTDKRGDIGSMVREAAMIVLLSILKKWVAATKQTDAANKSLLIVKGETVERIIALFLQQLAEKIDRVRLVAGSVLQDIFDTIVDDLPEFARKQELRAVFCSDNIKELVEKDQDKFDDAFETEVIKAELTHFAHL